MAMSIYTANDDAKRQEFFLVSPDDVTILEDLRGRHFPPDDDKIIEMAMSIFDNTQLQPIECRRQTIGTIKNKLVATSGFTRANAVRLIRQGFTGTDGVDRLDPKFCIKVIVRECSDEAAFIHNIVENNHRNATSDIDDAHNQERMRDRYGKSDSEIAKLYQYPSSNKVGRLRKLLQLDESEQLLVHRGLLSTAAALDLLDLDPDQRKAVIAQCQQGDETTKINGAKIQDAVRDVILNDTVDNGEVDEGEVDGNTTETTVVATTATKGKNYKPRTMSNLRKLFDATVADENTDPHVAKFVKDMQKWLAGKVGDTAMHNAFKRILEAQPTPVVEADAEKVEADSDSTDAA